jgi:hypothetical protein
LNGLIFLGFLYVFNYYMKSFLQSIMSVLVSTMSEEQAGMPLRTTMYSSSRVCRRDGLNVYSAIN